MAAIATQRRAILLLGTLGQVTLQRVAEASWLHSISQSYQKRRAHRFLLPEVPSLAVTPLQYLWTAQPLTLLTLFLRALHLCDSQRFQNTGIRQQLLTWDLLSTCDLTLFAFQEVATSD
jgi:hypothetical protein